MVSNCASRSKQVTPSWGKLGSSTPRPASVLKGGSASWPQSTTFAGKRATISQPPTSQRPTNPARHSSPGTAEAKRPIRVYRCVLRANTVSSCTFLINGAPVGPDLSVARAEPTRETQRPAQISTWSGGQEHFGKDFDLRFPCHGDPKAFRLVHPVKNAPCVS